MDPGLIACFVGENKKDMHSLTASAAMKLVWSKETYEKMISAIEGPLPDSNYGIFLALRANKNKSVAKEAKDLRNLAKACNFSGSYGSSYSKMQQLLVTDLTTATNLLDAKYEEFSRYEDWKKEVESDTEKTGVAKTMLGGIRHLRKGVMAENAWERAAASRQASNFMIQSAGAELAKKTICRLWDDGLFVRLDARFIAVIHDEVVWSVHRDHAWESIQIVWNAVSQPYTPDFAVPFYGSVSLGKNLGDQIEYSDDPVLPTQEWVEKTIASLFAEA
jgi:hypothetical protein